MKTKIVFVVLIIIFLILASAAVFLLLEGGVNNPSLGATGNNFSWTTGIYVSPVGNDSSACTRAEPCQTFGKVVSISQPGDVIHILEGDYPEPFTISKSGTAQNYISIVGHNAVLNGMVISGDYIVVSSVEVTGSISHGIKVEGKHVIVEDSSIHQSVTENGRLFCNNSGSWGSALKVVVGGEDIIFRRNSVYENCGEGIAVTQGVRTLIEDNVVRDNFSVNIYIDNSPFTTVQGNTVLCTGIYLRDERRPTGIAVAEETYDGWGAQRHDTNILNNWVDGCSDGIASWDPEEPQGMEINLVVKDNTITNGTRRSISLEWFNINVLIVDNKVYTPIHVVNPEGVMLVNNSVR